MASPKRTFYVMLVMITGLLYFLYAAYTSSIDGQIYRFASWNKVLGNLSYSSSSSPRSLKTKGETYSSLYIYPDSISNKNVSSNNSNPVNGKNETVEEKKNEQNGSNAKESQNVNQNPVPPVNNTKDNHQQVVEKNKQSVIQKIPAKAENVTVDYIVQHPCTNFFCLLFSKIFGDIDYVQEHTEEIIKENELILTGVITRTVYDSGFILPNVELCPDFGSQLQVAIIVTSAPKHTDARMAIRQTWGHYHQRSDVAIGFIVGRTLDAGETAIKKEAALYGDIIQANFVDSYNNLTLKSISMLEWVDNYCNKAKFVLKTDDDMFINIPKLLTFLSKHSKDKRKIFGRLAKKWKPIRNKASKYYVSVQQYKNSLFPDFTTGPAYLMTSDIVHELYTTALEKTYLKLEDVYTTGIVAQEKKVQRVHVNEFFNRRVTLNPCNVQKGISIHMVKTYEQYDLWKKLLDGRSKC